MLRSLILATVLIAALAQAVPLAAQGVSNGIIPRTTAQHYGLRRSWFTHIEMDSSSARVAHLKLFVSGKNTYRVHEIKYDGGENLISERDADRFGDALGADGAKRVAEERMIRLRRAGLNPVLEVREIPEVTLYAVTDQAVVHAIDGETGRTLWVSQIGRRDHPSMAPAVSNKYLAIVNGSNLFVVNRADGKHIWKRQLMGGPGAGPAMSDRMVFSPMVDGTIEGYLVSDHKKSPWIYKSFGRTLVQPTMGVHQISWPTDRGYLYVGASEEGAIRYRVETHDTIVAPPVFYGLDRLFFASVDGYVYAVHSASGDIEWKFSTGTDISHPPIPIGNAVYAVPDVGGMFRIDMKSGEEVWWTPRVRRFLAANSERVYCADGRGRIMIIDAKSGGRIDSMRVPDMDLQLINWQTDRIYVGTRDGAIQCLHEPRLILPEVHLHYTTDEDAAAAPENVVQGGADGAGELADEGGDDPFGGGGDDTFDGGDEGGGDDPFGGGGGDDDPFGGDGGGDDDPFGAGGDDDNPFG